MVAHTFSCPQGLFFNQITDGCDFLRNVNCGDKDTEETQEKKETTEEIENEEVLSEADNEEEDVEDPKSLKDILEIVKAAGSDSLQYFCLFIFGWLLKSISSAAVYLELIIFSLGGIEGLEQQIKEEEDAKKEEEDRRVRISSKTRSRLSQLLNKGQRPKYVTHHFLGRSKIVQHSLFVTPHTGFTLLTPNFPLNGMPHIQDSGDLL